MENVICNYVRESEIHIRILILCPPKQNFLPPPMCLLLFQMFGGAVTITKEDSNIVIEVKINFR